MKTVLAVAFAFLPSLASAREPDWKPKDTWVLMVGVLEWQDSSLATFPKENRQDRALEKQLKADGVPDDHVVFLEDKAATLDAVRRELASIATKAGAGSTVIFYFAGHGLQDNKETYFANYDVDAKKPKKTGLAMAELATTFKGWKGDCLILAADCCHSGALAGVVDGFAGESFRAACFASATASNVSTGAWTFTESLVAAFGGNGVADADGDGSITFSEVGAFVRTEMRFREGQLSCADAGKSFGEGWVLRAVDAGKALPKIDGKWQLRQYVDCEWNSEWFRAQVVDAKEGKLKVHYLGYKDSDDEWVGPKRLREPAPPGVKAGEALQVQWEGKWWPAHVVKVQDDFALIHYDDYGDEWDEWVTSKRWKRPGR